MKSTAKEKWKEYSNNMLKDQEIQCFSVDYLSNNVPFASWTNKLIYLASLIYCMLQLNKLNPKLYELIINRYYIFILTEPVNVAKFSDDLWLGVIGLSNKVIAGFPRNLF